MTELDSNEGDNDSKDKSNAKRKSWLGWLGFLVLILAAYFIHVEVQTWLGKEALNNTGLSKLTLEDALHVAENENKNVLVNISAIWCPTCRKLDKEIFSSDQVKTALAEAYVFTRIEYESTQGKNFMQKYKVSGFPTLIVLDAQGNKLRQLKLTFKPGEFISQL